MQGVFASMERNLRKSVRLIGGTSNKGLNGGVLCRTNVWVNYVT